MAISAKYSVEIIFARNKFIMFDFGDFGISVKCSWDVSKDQLYVYFGNNYTKKFMVDWLEMIEIGKEDMVHTVKIESETFENIKVTFSRGHQEPYTRLWVLLQKSFPEYIALYGR